MRWCVQLKGRHVTYMHLSIEVKEVTQSAASRTNDVSSWLSSSTCIKVTAAAACALKLRQQQHARCSCTSSSMCGVHRVVGGCF